MTSKELTRWMAFYELEPWGGTADDERAALVAWAAFTPHPVRKRVTIKSFVPRREALPTDAPATDDAEQAELETFFEGGPS